MHIKQYIVISAAARHQFLLNINSNSIPIKTGCDPVRVNRLIKRDRLRNFAGRKKSVAIT